MAYQLTKLVSDQSGVAAHQDPNLSNAWGLARSPSSPWWVSNAGTATATLYLADGTPQPLVVVIPGGNNTGVVFNPNVTSHPTEFSGASFIFVTENGTIFAWSGGVVATLVVDRSSVKANYKGVTLAERKGQRFLYVANFNGAIEVFDSTWTLVRTFTDKCLATKFIFPDQRFAPFNVAFIDGHIYATFALQDAEHEDDVKGLGNGFVDIFTTGGKLVKRLISDGNLNSPWGLAISPSNFGKFSNVLLVGNFGSGEIQAYNHCGKFLGTLCDANGQKIIIDGLWSIAFGGGNVVNNGNTNDLFFTAGPNDEEHGLFGLIQAI